MIIIVLENDLMKYIYNILDTFRSLSVCTKAKHCVIMIRVEYESDSHKTTM